MALVRLDLDAATRKEGRHELLGFPAVRAGRGAAREGGEGNREAQARRAARSRRSSSRAARSPRASGARRGATTCERYSDFANRLPRGRTYVNNGSVIDLQIERGKVEALVSGSEIYKVKIDVTVAAPARWKAICADCAGSVGSLVELLQGKLSKNVMERVCREADGLFPAPREIKMSCSCPDWAGMCKHVAATLYGVGARLDADPDLLFTLRGVDRERDGLDGRRRSAAERDAAPRATACSPTTTSRRCSVSTWPNRRRRRGILFRLEALMRSPARQSRLRNRQRRPRLCGRRSRRTTRPRPGGGRERRSASRIGSRVARRRPPWPAGLEGQRKTDRKRSRLRTAATPGLNASGAAHRLHNRVARGRPNGSGDGRREPEPDFSDPVGAPTPAPRSPRSRG